MEEYRVDVLVIGGGAAGLRAAIAARERGCDVLLLSKSTVGLGTATIISYGAFSSGGFGVTIEKHIERTMETGHFTNDPALVKILSEEAPVRIWELRHKGMKVKETQHGVVAEGTFPIFGRQIIGTLVAWAKGVNVRITNWITAVGLVVSSERIAGCVGVTAEGETVAIRAKAVILCSGGASALYRFHDNPIFNIGDGYAMASEAGAVIKDMEFIQFYPLVIQAPRLPKVLAPPAFADKGGIVNAAGEDIIDKYGLSTLKPIAMRGRDKLSIALYKEMMKGQKVYVDLRSINSNDSSLDLSGLETLRLLETGYHSSTSLLPVIPCAHFTIGGVVIDEDGKTSREGLFAAGEAACGVHGANRMGGNALSETLVFGYRAGLRAADFALGHRHKTMGQMDSGLLPGRRKDGLTAKYRAGEALAILRNVMWEHCGPVRNSGGLSAALAKVEALKEAWISNDEPGGLALSCAVCNAVDTAKIIIEAALKRKESIGAHCREDPG